MKFISSFLVFAAAAIFATASLNAGASELTPSKPRPKKIENFDQIKIVPPLSLDNEPGA